MRIFDVNKNTVINALSKMDKPGVVKLLNALVDQGHDPLETQVCIEECVEQGVIKVDASCRLMVR